MATTQSSKVERVCETCKKAFNVFPSRLKNGHTSQYCSQACRYNAPYSPKILPEIRFRAKVAPKNERGCELWIGMVNNKGYGTMAWGGKPHRLRLAHRIAWEIANGPIPDGLFLCHCCHTPRCVAIDHLFLGTVKDNIADKQAKGRQSKGERHKSPKLTNAEVMEIRRLHKEEGHSQLALGRLFGVDQSTICRIISRNNWDHI